MSAKRAAMRREKREREKAEKKKDDIERRAVKGRDDGREIAFFSAVNALHDHFDFGRKRISKLMEMCRKESARFSYQGVNYVFNFYAEKINDRLDGAEIIHMAFDDVVYVTNMSKAFVTALSVICTVLNEGFGMSSNSKGTGRIDKVINYACYDYIKILTGEKETEVPNVLQTIV
jgi:hypothetical protein